MSNLRDLIRLEIERGNFSEPFKVKELRALIDRNHGLLAGTNAPKDLNAYLANHSSGPGSRMGESVRRGKKQLFIKHDEPATYSIDYSTYEIESDTAPSDHGGKSGLPPDSPGSPEAKDLIAKAFVDYLKEKPYRQLATRLETTETKLIWGQGPVTGWNNRINAYEWNSADWPTTKLALAAFTRDLQTLESDWQKKVNIDDRAEVIYRRIRKWGNPRGTEYTGRQIVGFLSDLWHGRPIGQVDSTLTKLYALARPDEYVMYDSRVAAAIMTIAEDIYREKTIENRPTNTVVACFRSHFQNLGLYNGTGGTRQRGYRSGSLWPNAYRSVPAQLDANDLCKRIRDQLICDTVDKRSDWTLREVEAVLFMEGY
jgi:hypothetical protein